MATERRILKHYPQCSQLVFGGSVEQTDFKPAVKRACEEQKGAGKETFSTARSAKVIIIGAPGVGKTSMVLRYCRDIFERNYKTTIGVDFEVEKYQILGVPFSLQIWDTAGADRFRGVTTAYFRGAHVVIVAFDLTNDESLHKTREWLKEAEEFCQTNFYVFLVATKKDLMTSESTYEEILDKVTTYAQEYKAEYWSTSSKTGENVEELFSRVATVAFENVITRELESVRNSSISHNGHGQVASNSTLIRIQNTPKQTKQHSRTRGCCSRR